MREETLDFHSFFRIVFKRFWIVIFITLIAVLTSAYVSFHVLTPIYQAKVNLLISGHQDPKNPVLTTSIDDSLKLVTTYQDIVQSPLILQTAQLKLDEEGYDIRIDGEDISVGHTEESQVIELLVEHQDSTKASLIANAIAESFTEHIQDLMNMKMSNVKVMNKAAVDPDPVSPKPLLIMGITFVIALIISIWITLLIHNVSKSREVSKSARLEKS